MAPAERHSPTKKCSTSKKAEKKQARTQSKSKAATTNQQSGSLSKVCKHCGRVKTSSRKSPSNAQPLKDSPFNAPRTPVANGKPTPAKTVKNSLPSGCKLTTSEQPAFQETQLKTTSANDPPPSRARVPSSWFDSPEQQSLRESFLTGINKERRALSLQPLTLDPVLNQCAAKHNYDQAFTMNGIFHTGSDGSKLSDRLKRIGYAYRWAGENVAHRQETPQWAVNSFMKSPGHRKNIVNEMAEQMGFHGGVGKDGHWYWTQVLAAPK